MGMFDEVRCHYPLPGVGVPQGLFQTKSLDCDMSLYTITAEGRLICDKWHYEATPQDKLPYPETPFLGCLTRVVDEPDVDQNYHGALRFYGDAGDFTALFENGSIVHVIRHPEKEAP